MTNEQREQRRYEIARSIFVKSKSSRESWASVALYALESADALLNAIDASQAEPMAAIDLPISAGVKAVATRPLCTTALDELADIKESLRISGIAKAAAEEETARLRDVNEQLREHAAAKASDPPPSPGMCKTINAAKYVPPYDVSTHRAMAQKDLDDSVGRTPREIGDSFIWAAARCIAAYDALKRDE